MIKLKVDNPLRHKKEIYKKLFSSISMFRWITKIPEQHNHVFDIWSEMEL